MSELCKLVMPAAALAALITMAAALKPPLHEAIIGDFATIMIDVATEPARHIRRAIP